MERLRGSINRWRELEGWRPVYGHTYSKNMDLPGKVASPARGQLNRKNEYFPVPRSCLRIWSRETGSAVPSRVSLLMSVLRLNLVLTSGIPPEFRGGVHLFIHNRHTPSGQSRVYRVTQLRTDGVHCRESAGDGASKPQGGSERVLVRLSLTHPLLAWSGHVGRKLTPGIFFQMYFTLYLFDHIPLFLLLLMAATLVYRFNRIFVVLVGENLKARLMRNVYMWRFCSADPST